jgi:glycerophosphoryl diester phosphodiesterase
MLVAYGYNEKPEQIYLQCFDPQTLKRLRDEFHTSMPLIQLIDDEESPWFPSVDAEDKLAAALQEISTYAAGVGPSIGLLLKPIKAQAGHKAYVSSAFSVLAKEAGLEIHPYTVRADSLPPYMGSLKELLDELYGVQKVDAVFSDFCDRVLAYLSAKL